MCCCYFFHQHGATLQKKSLEIKADLRRPFCIYLPAKVKSVAQGLISKGEDEWGEMEMGCPLRTPSRILRMDYSLTSLSCCWTFKNGAMGRQVESLGTFNRVWNHDCGCYLAFLGFWCGGWLRSCFGLVQLSLSRINCMLISKSRSGVWEIDHRYMTIHRRRQYSEYNLPLSWIVWSRL